MRSMSFQGAEAAAHIDIAYNGETFRILLKRVSSARRYTLRVRSATCDVTLTMPARGSLKQARDFAERHAAWISTRRNRLPERVPFLPGTVVPLRGIDHLMRHCPGERGNVWVAPAEAGDAAAMTLCVGGEAPHFERRVADYLRAEARKDLLDAVRRYANAIGVEPTSITVRDTSSRWGSCSSKGSLNFSWRLILAPPFVLDYLAAHEIAHLRHHDHSSEFWALTRKICPHAERAEHWLKANGAQLHRYGRKAVSIQPHL